MKVLPVYGLVVCLLDFFATGIVYERPVISCLVGARQTLVVAGVCGCAVGIVCGSSSVAAHGSGIGASHVDGAEVSGRVHVAHDVAGPFGVCRGRIVVGNRCHDGGVTCLCLLCRVGSWAQGVPYRSRRELNARREDGREESREREVE